VNLDAHQALRLLVASGLFLAASSAGAVEQAAAIRATPCARNQSPPVFSQIGTTDEAVEAFLGALQRAVASDDRRKVATMIRYPITASTRERDVTLKTPDALLASCEVLFTPRLKQTIAGARKESLFTSWQGAMIHDGEIWINVLQTGDLKITRINGPRRRTPSVEMRRRPTAWNRRGPTPTWTQSPVQPGARRVLL
jgi:hypothetical protein